MTQTTTAATMTAKSYYTAARVDSENWDALTWNTWQAAQDAVNAAELAEMLREDWEEAKENGAEHVAECLARYEDAVREVTEYEENFQAHFNAEADAGTPGSHRREMAATLMAADQFARDHN